MNWDDLEGLADELASSERDNLTEARYRAAVSRCYYSVHNRILESDYAKKHHLTSKRHSNLVDALKAGSDPKWRAAGSKLDALKENRRNADYDPALCCGSKKNVSAEELWNNSKAQSKQIRNLTGLQLTSASVKRPEIPAALRQALKSKQAKVLVSRRVVECKVTLRDGEKLELDTEISDESDIAISWGSRMSDSHKLERLDGKVWVLSTEQ